MDEKERKKRIFIFLTFLFCCVAVALLAAALGTNYWIVSRLKDIASESGSLSDGNTNNDTIRAAKQVFTKNRPGGEINFGLFHGFVRHNKGLGDRQAELKTVCDSSCFHILIVDHPEHIQHQQQQQYSTVFNNFSYDLSSTDLLYTDLCAIDSSNTAPNRILVEPHLFSYGLWVATIFFATVAMLFGVVGAIYGLLNTTYTPVAVINGVAGLYLWSTIGIVCSLLCIFMWVILFYATFQYNVLPAELLYPVPKFTTCGIADLGFSFWLCITAMLMFALNIILLTVKDIQIRKPVSKHIAPSSNENMFMY